MTTPPVGGLGRTPQAYRGERLGLPESGPGSLCTTGVRLGAFIVDAVLSALIAALFVQAVRHQHDKADLASHLPGSWSLIPLAVDYLVGLLVAGRTVGMYLFGLRVIRVDRDDAVRPVEAVVRTGLLFLLIPAVVWDRDGRGLHDRASGTAVVRG